MKRILTLFAFATALVMAVPAFAAIELPALTQEETAILSAAVAQGDDAMAAAAAGLAKLHPEKAVAYAQAAAMLMPSAAAKIAASVANVTDASIAAELVMAIIEVPGTGDKYEIGASVVNVHQSQIIPVARVLEGEDSYLLVLIQHGRIKAPVAPWVPGRDFEISEVSNSSP